MKKVLILTDGYVDLTPVIKEWFDNRKAPVDLTVVVLFAKSELPAHPLMADACYQAAQTVIAQWHTKVAPKRPHRMHTETTLSDASLALTMQLQQRHYNYLLMAISKSALPTTFDA